ncbi:MAG: hypothetical protein Tp125SUR00d2C35697761_37 [Prokaryotic dsDNA virus sp.]|nr:MAG: hypothetical protein Tp125SUR00d2C35697761_37 [Prokaryotic dsDNA virus sp.]QDP66082.1 MAG: hypothetical protein Unbinned4336contig1000_47 [Prokaryotic dsDNA virus sp.]|tara:strand:- start:5940 stop:6461 length:522 start_codon:yes stop_codon:yes gene_type:complete
MSIYATAVTSGIEALAGIKADQAYDQAYNVTYAAEAQRANIRNAMHAAELNVTAVRQDKVLTNTMIGMKQDEAEAAAKVAAATAGVEGGSVDDIIYETEKNESLAINSANRRAEQSIESQLAQIGSGMSSLLAVNDDLPEISYIDNLLGAVSSFELDDARIGEAFAAWSGGEA